MSISAQYFMMPAFSMNWAGILFSLDQGKYVLVNVDMYS